MQVEVHDVHAEVARPGLADERVHVRAVAVDQAALRVDDPRHLADLILEHPQGVRVGQHDARRRRRSSPRRAPTPRGCPRAQDFSSRPRTRRSARSTGWCRAPSRGSARACAAPPSRVTRCLRIIIIPVSSPCAPAAGCSVTAGSPVISPSIAASACITREHALRHLVRRERVLVREARHPRRRLVHLRVVLHRARPERVHAAVHAVVPGGQAREVAHDADLTQLREPGHLLAHSPAGTFPSTGVAGTSGAGSE